MKLLNTVNEIGIADIDVTTIKPTLLELILIQQPVYIDTSTLGEHLYSIDMDEEGDLPPELVEFLEQLRLITFDMGYFRLVKL